MTLCSTGAALCRSTSLLQPPHALTFLYNQSINSSQSSHRDSFQRWRTMLIKSHEHRKLTHYIRRILGERSCHVTEPRVTLLTLHVETVASPGSVAADVCVMLVSGVLLDQLHVVNIAALCCNCSGQLLGVGRHVLASCT